MSLIKNEFVNNLSAKTKKQLVKYNRALLATLLIIASAFSLNVLGTSVKTFNINDGRTIKTVYTLKSDITSALCSAQLDSDDYEVLSTKRKGDVTEVKIGYTFCVAINVGDKTVTVKTTENTVEDILLMAGYKLDEYDFVEPSADTVLSSKSVIDYSNVDFISGSYTEAIPCSLETVYNAELEKGQKTVLQGTDGKKEVYYTSKLVNGKEVETVINNTVVLSNAVNGKQIIGTKATKNSFVTTSEQVSSVSTLKPEKEIGLDASGNPVNYKKKLTVQATGYTYTGHNCATGVAPQPGYIAVNPNVIPYGTKMYIKSTDGRYIYGYAVAADTGGFVRSRPNNVDLFFATRSAAVAFGRRNVEIYIIE